MGKDIIVENLKYNGGATPEGDPDYDRLIPVTTIPAVEGLKEALANGDSEALEIAIEAREIANEAGRNATEALTVANDNTKKLIVLNANETTEGSVLYTCKTEINKNMKWYYSKDVKPIKLA